MVTPHNNKNGMNKRVQRTARLRPLNVAIRVAMAGGIAVGTLPGGLRAELPSPAAAWSQVTGTTYRFGNTTATFSDRALNVHQRDSKVVLDWNSFSIGSGNTVTFNQPGKDAVAINKVIGTDPSRIFGNLNANGQVYLINTNGILFGTGAQVNVRTLVASTLDMTQEALDNGILAPGADASARRPAFEGAGTGSVNIQAGAVLRADGGRVLVFAPQITNDGLIRTPGGQTVLAAGQKIYISSVGIEDTSNPELIGQLLVEVDVSGVTQEALQAFLRGESATLPAGTATNRGVIEALRGNVSMVGLAVNQNGRVSATTSVRQNGSIRLVASDRGTGASDPARGGRVQLGENSVSRVQLELDSTDTAVDADVQKQSSVRIAGHSVHIERDAQVLAPSGKVEISANAQGATAPNLADAATNDSRVRIAEGARIDVSGANIAMPVSSNLLEVELRGAQLQNSPYQRDGILRNAKVVVDIRETGVREDGTEWVGTPLADLGADVAAIGKTVGERSLEGGTVTIASQGDALIEAGSTIDVSGGAIKYLDDGVTTTRLVSNGRVYDIADAPEDLRYDQILTTFTKDYTKWGVRRVWNLFPNRNEPGYLRGFDAGGFQLVASRGVLEGSLRGGVVVGPKQRERAPRGGEFAFGLPPNAQFVQDFDLRSPDIVFSSQKRLNALLAGGFNVYGDALPAAFDSFYIDPQLFDEEGMHRARLYSNGRILLPEDV
ncbi:MAG TPA: filamentous hemagglutinin N-terminal domain-containing protein, partial [Gammaproteobacteria bacterium]